MHCLGNSILFRAKTAFQNKAAKEIAPSGEPLSKKAIASTGETRVINPTQKASKRVVNSTPKGARTEHARSTQRAILPRKTQAKHVDFVSYC